MIREGPHRHVYPVPAAPKGHRGKARAVHHDGRHRRVRPIQAADEVCRGELGKSRNKQGRRGRGSRNHKEIACFFEAQGIGSSSDLLELEKELAGAGHARRNHLARKKFRDYGVNKKSGESFASSHMSCTCPLLFTRTK